MNLITIHFDGGCKPANPGNKYGSYEVQLNNLSVCKVSRVRFGFGTNNEAEFDSLIQALNWTVRELLSGGFPVEFYTVKMYTDSTVLLNRIGKRNTKGKSEPARRMAALTAQVLANLKLFNDWSIEWRGRDANVARFGH